MIKGPSDKLKKLSKSLGKKKNLKIAFPLPLNLLLIFLLVPPLLLAIYLSFTNWTPLLGSWWDARITWLKNYFKVLTDMRFYWALIRTVIIVFIGVSAELALGLLLAITFSKKFPGRKFFTSVMIYPMMLPWVVVGLTFYLLFLKRGLINAILSYIAGSEVAISWLYNSSTAFFAIIIADVWQWTPFMFLVLYSGLTALPQAPIEAARISGATEWQILKDIKLPQLKRIILIAVIIRSLEAFKIFDKIFIMTRGGPGTSTESISVYLYKLGFAHSRLAYVSAMALMIMAALIVVTRFASKPLIK